MMNSLTRTLLAASFTFFAISAFALEGHWIGRGEIRDSRNAFNGPCTKLEYAGHRDGNTYVLDYFVYRCGTIASEWVGLRFSVDGQNLLDTDTGESMGQILENGILFTYQGAIREALRVTKNSNNEVQVDFVTQNVLGKFQITGQLPQASR